MGDVPAVVLDQIAAGFGDSEVIGWLAERQAVITRALLRAEVDQHGPIEAWHALIDIEEASPEAVREVLIHPYVRPWAVDRLRRPGVGSSYLTTLAAAAGIRAGIPVTVEADATGGVLHLPTIGTAYLPAGTDRPVRIEFDGTTTRIVGAGEDIIAGPVPSASWQPARTVELEEGWSIRIEDGDPARACHSRPPAGRLSGEDEERWRSALTGAWRLTRAELPGYAPALRAALRTVVPLRTERNGQQRASTARHAFGSVATTLADPADLAVILVHEFQHGKLGALLDLCDLVDLDSDTHIRVGWRPDPRPIEGVLQGIYAHAAVADVHRARINHDADAEPLFTKYYKWTADAIAELRTTDALTPLGRDFLDRLESTMRGWT